MPFTIVLAEDDEDDRELAQDALQASGFVDQVQCVVDGQDLLDYLRRAGRWADPSVDAPFPAIILLDLNMPRKNGREALAEIKADAALRAIPVVILTTSRDAADVSSSYDFGASAFITKPDTFEEFVEVMRVWTRYWFEIAELPHGGAGVDRPD